jgi:hypothetical protein
LKIEKEDSLSSIGAQKRIFNFQFSIFNSGLVTGGLTR